MIEEHCQQGVCEAEWPGVLGLPAGSARFNSFASFSTAFHTSRMTPGWGQLGILLVAASVLPGCVTVHAPLEGDRDYPAQWGELQPLGPECKALEGTYLNEGKVAAASDGPLLPLSLTSVLNVRSDARTVSLNVYTRRLDERGDAFITLRVVPDHNAANARELEGCFCIKQTLACTQVSETYWSLPNFGFGGKQSNVYFSMSRDRSLVAKLQNYHADVIWVVPLFGMKEPWARFGRDGQ